MPKPFHMRILGQVDLLIQDPEAIQRLFCQPAWLAVGQGVEPDPLVLRHPDNLAQKITCGALFQHNTIL
ncbi:hypothetical protein [Castellaniella sp.]|uniref:hypothetical protein n=1 Tax=Castellaniella sp. TaxID=1955812 RepID=UPI002AFFDBC7|nr:hypothetical protein [Castellaniella sp.]